MVALTLQNQQCSQSMALLNLASALMTTIGLVIPGPFTEMSNNINTKKQCPSWPTGWEVRMVIMARSFVLEDECILPGCGW